MPIGTENKRVINRRLSMPKATLINPDEALRILREKINKEMIAAAEPFIQEALVRSEKAMRERLGSLIISYIDQSFSVERMGTDLRIIIKRDLP